MMTEIRVSIVNYVKEQQIDLVGIRMWGKVTEEVGYPVWDQVRGRGMDQLWPYEGDEALE